MQKTSFARYIHRFATADWAGRLRLLNRVAWSLIVVRPLRCLASFCLRVIGQLSRVRIGILICSRIGHLAVDTELFLRRQAAQEKDVQEFQIFVTHPDVANRQLLTMIKRRLRVVGNSFLWEICKRGQPSLRDSGIWIDLPHSVGPGFFDELNNIPPQLSFTEEEEARGIALLASMGLAPETPFVCFFARDKAYLDSVLPRRSGYWGYLDYRDCDIENCLPAAEYLAAQGIYALRMGAIVERRLPRTNKRIIDYATSFRSDFGDIYLLAKCKFFLGSVSGIHAVSTIFGVPIASTNVTSFSYAMPSLKSDLFIPKKIWSVERKRILTFREMLEFEARFPWKQLKRGETYTQAGLEFIENSADEILALAREMNERLDGTWVSTEEDEELQQRFRALFPPGHRCYGFPSRIGTEFLRQNRELLD